MLMDVSATRDQMITIARMVKSVANSAGMKPRFERMIFVAELSISSGLFMKGSPMSSLVRNSRWIPLLLVSSAAACVPQASDAPSAAAEAAPVAPVASAIEALAEPHRRHQPFVRHPGV
ncbi:MAG TPA: hypothetical protein PKU97_03930, partial [Kofleriaceae bacterium]|nr:hypothetical protein [Kofleriaceae bacterium]